MCSLNLNPTVRIVAIKLPAGLTKNPVSEV